MVFRLLNNYDHDEVQSSLSSDCYGWHAHLFMWKVGAYTAIFRAFGRKRQGKPARWCKNLLVAGRVTQLVALYSSFWVVDSPCMKKAVAKSSRLQVFYCTYWSLVGKKIDVWLEAIEWCRVFDGAFQRTGLSEHFAVAVYLIGSPLWGR